MAEAMSDSDKDDGGRRGPERFDGGENDGRDVRPTSQDGRHTGSAGVRISALHAAEASDQSTDRLLGVAHELGNLVDGALRTVELARRGVGEAAGDPTRDQQDLTQRLDAAHAALARMAGLLHEAMRPQGAVLFSGDSARASLIEAILHAAEVHRPLAETHGVEMSIECSPRLVLTPAGSIYTVLVNGIRNAIEVLAATGQGGRIEIVAELATDSTGEPEVQIDVLDDGPGPPQADEQRLFHSGFTTKRGGLGVGLSLCREVVGQMRGTVHLLARRPSDAVRPASRGARFSVRYPAPFSPTHST